jgi:predicted kinase
VVLRSDVERKALFGRDENEKLPAEAYTPEVNLQVYAAIADKASRVAAAGHCAIMDAVFAAPAERGMAERSAAALGVRFRGFILEAPLTTRLERIGKRRGDASDADRAVALAQENYDLGDLDQSGWQRIDASGTPDETLAQALRALRQ